MTKTPLKHYKTHKKNQMKKILLSMAVLVSTLSVNAQSNSEIACQWANLIDGGTTAGDQSTEVTLDSKTGNVYFLGTYGSTNATPDIQYAGEKLFSGAGYEGTSQNNNYTLLKTDPMGNKLWVAYSNSGDFENNAGGMSATRDGGVITVNKVRHTDGNPAPIRIIDAGGKEYTYNWEDPAGSRIYKMLTCRFDPEGNLQWAVVTDFDTTPGPAASSNYTTCWANVFNVGSVATDDNDNVYIALNYRNPVTFKKADGSPATFTPKNNTKWTGDPQTACGDFMLASFDGEGHFRKALTLDGTATAAYCQKVVYDKGRIVAQGYITGDGSEMKAAGITLSPSTVMSPLVLSTDTDLNIMWAKCYKGHQVDNKNALQNVGITLCGDNIWMCGQYNLKFTDCDNAANYLTATQGNIREAFILKLDAATGAWMASRNSRDDEWDHPSALAKTGLTGYFKVIINEAQPDKIHVFGYVMNANVGIFLREYNAATLEANLTTGQNNIVTGGGVPSCQSIAYDANHTCCYVTARGNKAFNVKGFTDAVEAPQSWGILAAKFSLPADMYSGVANIAVPENEADVTNAPVEYYNLQGQRVSNPISGQLYIRRCGNTVTKVILP